MLAAEITIDRFPPHEYFHLRRRAAPRVDWVSLGSEYDIAHIVRLWQLAMRFSIESLPDDESVMWQLADKLRGRRSDTVMIREAVVSIDRRHMAAFREAMDWLWDEVCADHPEDYYEDHGTVEEPIWIRKDDAPTPMTALEDSQRAIDIIEALRDGWVDNIIKIREDA